MSTLAIFTDSHADKIQNVPIMLFFSWILSFLHCSHPHILHYCIIAILPSFHSRFFLPFFGFDKPGLAGLVPRFGALFSSSLYFKNALTEPSLSDFLGIWDSMVDYPSLKREKHAKGKDIYYSPGQWKCNGLGKQKYNISVRLRRTGRFGPLKPKKKEKNPDQFLWFIKKREPWFFEVLQF